MHTSHIVSNIGGEKKNVNPGDVIRSVFPGGTITDILKLDVWKS